MLFNTFVFGIFAELNVRSPDHEIITSVSLFGFDWLIAELYSTGTPVGLVG